MGGNKKIDEIKLHWRTAVSNSPWYIYIYVPLYIDPLLPVDVTTNPSVSGTGEG